MASLPKHGFPDTKIFVHTGIHVPAGIIMQGCGVNTPKAAAVAAATCGFNNDVHIPNPEIFTGYDPSSIVAAGLPFSRQTVCDVTVRLHGAVPKPQAKTAPDTTITPYALPPLL